LENTFSFWEKDEKTLGNIGKVVKGVVDYQFDNSYIVYLWRFFGQYEATGECN
jgi:hypothetical protein